MYILTKLVSLSDDGALFQAQNKSCQIERFRNRQI